jgi:EKC/KEOPS complex subunit CGI121/TPRKB
VWKHLSENVQGTAVPFSDDEIAKTTDWAKVSKYYKLNGAPALKGIKDEGEKRRETEMLILSSMALRGV